VVQCKRIIEIHPCTGVFPDSLTVVQHFRKGFLAGIMKLALVLEEI